MNIIYSFNKRGYVANFWRNEIAAATDEEFTFIPFNHDPYLDTNLYVRAQLLDNLYFEKHPGLMRLYADFEALIQDSGASAVIVDNHMPYHPDYLRKIPIYKVLRTSNGPINSYEQDFAYLHAYDHVLYHSPAYSSDLDMEEKLRYCGAKNLDWWPLGLFDVGFDHGKTEDTILSGERDIDLIFIGSAHLNKMPILVGLKKIFGRRFRWHGLCSWKKNLYIAWKHRLLHRIRPIPWEQYVPLYQRAKIGINVHNRGDFTVGGYRLFELPANGVMQISDGGRHLEQFFKVGEEVERYKNLDDLVDKLRYYLEHEEERQRIALNGYRRVLQDYRFAPLMRRAGELIKQGMNRIDWKPGKVKE
jgi:hypothetical protein